MFPVRQELWEFLENINYKDEKNKTRPYYIVGRPLFEEETIFGMSLCLMIYVVPVPWLIGKRPLTKQHHE